MFRALAPAVEHRDVIWPGFTEGRLAPVRSRSTSYHYSTSDAFQIAAVVACVGLRSGALAQIPIKGYNASGPLGTLVDPQPELLVSPSPTVVPSIWKTQMSISRDIWGYAAGKILAVDAAGYPAKVEWLSPDICKAHQEVVGGPLIWRVGNSEIDSSLIFHVPSRWVVPGNPLGISPLAKSGLVDLAKKAQDFGRDWFANGAMPSALLYSDEELTTKQADGILDRMMARWESRRPAVIGSGMKYEKVSIPANESQFLDTMIKAASDIAISFNLPPSKIAASMSSSDVKYQNLEQNTQQYLMDSINPDLVVVQEVIATHLRPGVYPRWQTGAFLRSDLKTRYESYQIGIVAGFLEEDEVRGLEDLPPKAAKQGGFLDAKGLADAIQRLAQGVGIVLTADEARVILNRDGANLAGPMPDLMPGTFIKTGTVVPALNPPAEVPA